MLQKGTRPYYVIYSASKYDELNHNVWYIGTNKKEAIARFRWIYKHWASADYTNDEGEIWAEHDFNLNEEPDGIHVRGSFYFWEDEGEVQYALKTMNTNEFNLWAGYDRERNRWEEAYQAFRKEQQ